MEMKKGTRVTWESQANGTWKSKAGTVIECVPVACIPTRAKIRNPGLPRNHVSYLIQEDGGKFYWPRVSALRAIARSE